MDLPRFALQRAAQLVATVAALLLVVFFVVRLAPGGPAQALLGADYYTPERAAELDRQLGLYALGMDRTLGPRASGTRR